MQTSLGILFIIGMTFQSEENKTVVLATKEVESGGCTETKEKRCS